MSAQSLETRTVDIDYSSANPDLIYQSLRPEIRQSLSEEQEGLVHALDRFEAPYLQEKLLEEGRFESPEEYKTAFTEFKKFVVLAGLYGGGQGMISKEVDAVWHQLILFTPQYHEFCQQVLGRYLHHVPTTSFTPLGKDLTQNFIRNYQGTFGEMPAMWKGDETCDNPSKKDYRCDNPDCAPPGCQEPEPDLKH